MMTLCDELWLADFGGILSPVDIDGDRNAEFLWLQSPGFFHAAIHHRKRPGMDHFCLTATDHQGKIIWQIGTPWAADTPWATHCAERSLTTFPTADGLKIAVACLDHILLIDAMTGTVEKRFQCPYDNFVIAQAAMTKSGAIILASPSDKSYEGHRYCNPVLFLDERLNLLSKQEYLGAGHTPLIADIDGDGFEEWIIGYNLVDHDLKTIWSLLPEPADAYHDKLHADAFSVGTLGALGRCLAVAAGDLALLLGLDGSVYWQRAMDHAQACLIGQFDGAGGQVFVHNKRGVVQLLDPEGRELWRMEPPAHWPLGKPPHVGMKFHMIDPIMKLPGLAGGDMIVFSDAGWPYVIDGKGGCHYPFECPKTAAQDYGPVAGRPDDYGYGYHVRFCDSSDYGSCIVVNDRRHAWIFSLGSTRALGKDALPPKRTI